MIQTWILNEQNFQLLDLDPLCILDCFFHQFYYIDYKILNRQNINNYQPYNLQNQIITITIQTKYKQNINIRNQSLLPFHQSSNNLFDNLMSQQLFMRDDIIQFNNQLDSECYNIKAYRKRKSKSKKTSALNGTVTEFGFSQENILRINKSMDKSEFNQEKNQEKRASLTAAIKRRPQIVQHLRNFNKSVNMRSQISSHKKQQSLLGHQDVKTAKINYANNNQQTLNNNVKTQRNVHSNVAVNNLTSNPVPTSQFSQSLGIQSARLSKELDFSAKNKYRQLQKKVHKNGPISQKSIQNWLDQILTQYCHQQQFDKSIQNAALKKMSIDRNSLLSQGIKPQYVNRVYKSLFVYSIGFNNLLKELSGKNTHLKKTIWKVYAILLQFCSQGTFETMIGEIQRDKIHKLQGLRQQIQKRQRIIQNNDQINEQKNSKIFKQLKQLKQQNTNLQNQKNVLMQDFKQAQQSFNQQVSIRLKFQNKINEIYGIHNQLNNKHQRLYDDYQNKLEESIFLETKLREINDNFLITREKLLRTEQQLQEEKRNNATCNEMLAKYEQMRTRFQNSQIELKNSKDDLLNIIKEKSRKISQLQVQLQNSQIMLKLSKSSYKQLQQQYRESLQQNKKLHHTIRDQINQLNELFTQKKNFNQKHMSYVAQIEFLKNKDTENKIVTEKLRKQLKEDRETNDKLFLEKTTLEKKVQTLDSNLKDCYDNIENMKKTKNLYQEELVYLKKRSQLHGQIVREKDASITTLTKSNQKLVKQNQSLITLNKSLDSKTTVLTQRLHSQQQINKKKFEKLRQQRDQLFKQNSQHNAILQQKIFQLQKYMSLYDKQMLNLKNQRFQRVNLDLRYKQSLQVMESQNQHIKKLNIVISENHQEIQEWKRKYRNLQYILKEKEHLFQVERDSLKMYLEEARKEVTKKKMFLNPMIVEDLKGLLKRAIEKYDALLADYIKKVKQFKSAQASLAKTIQALKDQNLSKLTIQQQQSSKKVQQIQYQLQYQKQRCKHLQQKVQSLEKILNHNKSAPQVNTLKQKQMKYLSTIKQKSQNIQKLLKQLQSSHDHNNTLIKRLSEVDGLINGKNEQISQLERKLTKVSQDYEQLERHKGFINNRQKETVSSKMDDYYDENLLAMNGANNENLNILAINKDNSKLKNRPSSRVPTGRSNTKKLSSKDQTQERQGQQGVDNNQRNNTFGSSHKNRQKSSDKVVNPVWRNDLGKKLKNAFNYYAK